MGCTSITHIHTPFKKTLPTLEGEWSSWLPWSGCPPSSCDSSSYSSRARFRLCLGPVGAKCAGNATQEEQCPMPPEEEGCRRGSLGNIKGLQTDFF